MISKAAMKIRGGSGPSGLDADGWKRTLLSKNFGESSSGCCQMLAKVTKKPCTEELSTSLEEFQLCRLIPINKNSGLRAIGVGEESSVLRRIIKKSLYQYSIITLYIQLVHCKSVQVMKQVVKRQFTQCAQYLRMRKQK